MKGIEMANNNQQKAIAKRASKIRELESALSDVQIRNCQLLDTCRNRRSRICDLLLKLDEYRTYLSASLVINGLFFLVILVLAIRGCK